MTNYLFWFAYLATLPGVIVPTRSAPDLLSFDELVTLSQTAHPAPPLQAKLDALLHTPFTSNAAAPAAIPPHRPVVNGLGPVLRVASWNIERGLNFDLIKLALSDPDGFLEAARRGGAMQVNRSRSNNSFARCVRPTSSSSTKWTWE